MFKDNLDEIVNSMDKAISNLEKKYNVGISVTRDARFYDGSSRAKVSVNYDLSYTRRD